VTDGFCHLGSLIADGIAAAGCVQTALGVLAARRFPVTVSDAPEAESLPAITMFKPLRGTDALTERALETCFRQDYPSFQIVFGVQDPADPVVPIVRRLCALYPGVDATLVVDPSPHGANRKIANLINMVPLAKYDTLVVSDGDMHVPPEYLRRVAAALARPGVGLATTLYTGLPANDGVTAQLGAAYINQIFSSGALMSRFLGRQDCLGATMALTRETLRRIGGFAALADFVADDGVLGRRVRDLGLAVALAPTIPATTVAETSLVALFRHELRWARTIRAMAPAGFLASSIQFPVFWSLLALLLSYASAWSGILLALSLLLRAGCGRAIENALGAAPTRWYLAPARDLLSVAIMATAFAGRQVAWRDQVLSTVPDRDLVRGDAKWAAAGPRAAGWRIADEPAGGWAAEAKPWV
jgi:ceramide glucosyltransferase